MKLQPYKFSIIYQPGVKHCNANTMTRPPVVCGTDIISVVSEPQVKRVVAI